MIYFLILVNQFVLCYFTEKENYFLFSGNRNRYSWQIKLKHTFWFHYDWVWWKLLFGYSRIIRLRGRRVCDDMVVGFPTTCAISAYHHKCEFKSRSCWGVLDTTLCNKVCQLLFATGRWFSPVSSTNKTDRHDRTEILLKVALSIISY